MAVRLPSCVLYLVLIVLTILVPRAAPSASQVTGGAAPQKRDVATDIQDLQSVVISLHRANHLYGLSYSLKITGDGIVEYHGRGYYYVTGRHRRRISDEEVRELLEAFQDADFYSLEDESMLVFDRQIIEISLTIGGQTKTVDDRLGEFGQSQRFNQLAARIDQLSHADQWLTEKSRLYPDC